MQRFKKLLVVLAPGGKEQPALHRAVQLARHHHAALDILDVIDEGPRYLRYSRKRLHGHDTAAASKGELLRRVEAYMIPLHAIGLRVNMHTVTGPPGREIIRMVQRDHYDLVVKTVEPGPRWEQRLRGNIDRHLVRQCPSAVWLVQPTEPVCYRRLLVAIDPDSTDHRARELGMHLLRLGRSLAQSEGADLMVGHAWHPFAETKLKYHLPRAEFGRYLRGYKQASAARLRTFLSIAYVDVPPDRIRLAKGEASVVIPQLAKRYGVDLVVMGTTGRSGMQGLFIGNTVERALHRLDCSILVLKSPEVMSSVRVASDVWVGQ